MTLRRINTTLWITVRHTRLHWCIQPPAYYNASDDDTVIDFDEKIALIDTTGFDIKDTKKYKELQRKCMALVRGAVQLEKKEKLTWKY
jgi:hypothetical protein